MTRYALSLHNHLNPINSVHKSLEEKQIRNIVYRALELGIDVLAITKPANEPIPDYPLRFIQKGNLGEAYTTYNFNNFSLIEYKGKRLYFVSGTEVFVTTNLGGLGSRSGEIILMGYNPNLYKFQLGRGKRYAYTEEQKREIGSMVFRYLELEHPSLVVLPHPMDMLKGFGKKAGVNLMLDGIVDTYESHNSSFVMLKPDVNEEAKSIRAIIGREGISGNDGLLSSDIGKSLTYVKVNAALPPEELLKEIFDRVKKGELENEEGKMSLQGILVKSISGSGKWKRLKNKFGIYQNFK